jgi:hypothetical protein
MLGTPAFNRVRFREVTRLADGEKGTILRRGTLTLYDTKHRLQIKILVRKAEAGSHSAVCAHLRCTEEMTGWVLRRVPRGPKERT